MEGKLKDSRRVTEQSTKPDLPHRSILNGRTSDLFKLIVAGERKHSERGEIENKGKRQLFLEEDL